MPGEGKGLVRSLDLEKTKNQNNIATRSPSNPALGHPTDGGDTRRPQHHDTPLLSQRATGRITQRVLSKLHLLTSARKSKGSHHHSHAAEDASSKPHQQQHVWKLLPSQRQRLSEVYHTNHDCIRNFWGVYRLIHECSISISPPLLMEALAALGVKIGEQESLFLSEDQFLLLIEDIMCDDRHLETYFEDDRKLVELALTSSSVAATTTTSSTTAVESHNNSSPYTTSLNHHHAMPSSPPPAASHVESISVASLSNVLHRYHIDQSSPMTTNATPLPPDRMLPTNSDGGKTSISLFPLVQQPPFIAAVLSELGTPTNVGDHNGGGAKRKSMSMNGSTGDAPPPGHSSVLLGSSFTSTSSIAPTTTITTSKERDVQIPLEYLCATLNRTTIATPDPLVDFRPAGVGKGGGTCAPAALQNKMRGMSLALQRRSLGLPPPASTAATVPTATSQGTTFLGAPDATSDSGGQQRSSSNDNVSHHHGGLPALHPTRLRGNNPHHEMTIAPFPMYRRALVSTRDHQQLRRKDSMEALFVDTLQQCHTATTAVLRHARLVAGEGSDADSEFEEEVEILGEDSLARFRQRLQVIADHKLAALRQQRKDRLKQQHNASGGFHSSPRSYPKPWTGTDSSSAAGSPRRLEQQQREEGERKSCNRMSMKELIHEIEKLSEDEKRCLTPQTRQLVSIALLADEKAAGHVSKGVASVMSEGTYGLVGGAALPPLRSPQASKQQDDSAAAKASPVPKQQWDRWTRGGGQGITPSKHRD